MNFSREWSEALAEGLVLYSANTHHHCAHDRWQVFWYFFISAKFVGPYPGVKRDVWRGVKGTTVTDLAMHKNYPNHPTETSIIEDFDAPKNEGDDYGSRLQGYFVAPYTGTYSFSLSGNDEAELFFSGSSREKDKDLFAVVKGTGHNEFAQ